MEERTIEQLLKQAWDYRRQSRYKEALAATAKAEISCDPENHLYRGRICHIHAQIEADQGNDSRALELTRQAVDHYHRSANPSHIAHAVRHLADRLRRSGKLEAAENSYREAIGYYRSDSAGSNQLANALRGYGLLLEALGRRDAAVEVWQEVKTLYEDCQLPEGVAEAEERLAALR